MSLIELIMARDLTRYFFYIVYHVIVTVIENIFWLFGNIWIQFWKTLGYLYIYAYIIRPKTLISHIEWTSFVSPIFCLFDVYPFQICSWKDNDFQWDWKHLDIKPHYDLRGQVDWTIQTHKKLDKNVFHKNIYFFGFHTINFVGWSNTY